MTVARDELCGLIPHAGSMCLLDAVVAWDDDHVVCTSESHRRGDNPLRGDDGLPALHALEYGAQAMAVHGGLLARASGETNPPGYLAAIRQAQLYVQRLDTLAGPLRVEARRRMVQGGNLMYEIEVTAGRRPVAQARVTVACHEDETGQGTQ